MTDGDREMIRRTLVETLHAIREHVDAIEAVIEINLGHYPLVVGPTRARMMKAFGKLDVQFAPPAGREERG